MPASTSPSLADSGNIVPRSGLIRAPRRARNASMRAEARIGQRDQRMRSNATAPSPSQRLADEDLMTLVDEKDPDAFAVALRPPRRRRVSRSPIGSSATGHRRGRHAGGLPLDLAQQRALRRRARERPLVGARHRPQPGDRRAAPRGATRAEARPRRRRGARDAARRAAHRDAEAIRRETARARPRGARAAAARAVAGDRARLLRRLQPLRDRRDAGCPLGTIKGRMRLGLEKIRTTLAEGFGIDEDASGALP